MHQPEWGNRGEPSISDWGVKGGEAGGPHARGTYARGAHARRTQIRRPHAWPEGGGESSPVDHPGRAGRPGRPEEQGSQ